MLYEFLYIFGYNVLFLLIVLLLSWASFIYIFVINELDFFQVGKKCF